MFENIPAGDKAPEEINVIVEITKGSNNKYEVDEETGALFLDRTLYGPQAFPFEYGFMPQTASEDGDPLDIVLLASRATFPGCAVKARPIGMIFMEDEAGVDNKIVAVPKTKIDPRFEAIKDVDDLPEHQKKEIQNFFETYKLLEPGKFVKITGWGSLSEAKKNVEKALERYSKK